MGATANVGKGWDANLVDPEDTGSFRKPDLRVIPAPVSAPPADTSGGRHRAEPMPEAATEMFDIVGESVTAAVEALDRSERAGSPQQQLDDLRAAVGYLLKAVDHAVEGTVAMFDRR